MLLSPSFLPSFIRSSNILFKPQQSNTHTQKKKMMYREPVSFLKNLELVDNRVNPEDFEKATEIRRNFNHRLQHEPVFDSVRDILDRADQLCPRRVDAVATAAVVTERSRKAMFDLRAQLQSIKSNAEHSQFKETAPLSTTETRVRGSYQTDTISEHGTGDSSRRPKTSVNVNARPLNPQAAASRRDQFLKQSGLPHETPEGKVNYCGRVTARLHDQITPEQETKLVQAISCTAPWDEKQEAPEGLEGKDYQKFIPKSSELKPRIEVREDGKKYLVVEAVARDKERDVAQKFVNNFVCDFLDFYDDSPEDILARDSLPDLVRLATLRVDFPTTLGDFLNNAPSPKSWVSLFDGTRINWEVILRRQYFQNLVESKLTKGLVSSFDKDELVPLLMSVASISLCRDFSVAVQQAPPELSFGMLVKEAGHVCRRTAESESYSSHYEDAANRWYAEKFSACGWENLVASFVGSFLRLGLTTEYVKDKVTVLSALAPIGVGHEPSEVNESDKLLENQDSFLLYFISILQGSLRQTIAEIQKIEIFANAFEAQAEFEGLDESLWSFIPITPQEMVDAAKPYILAFSDDWSEFDYDLPVAVDPSMAEPRNMFPKNLFSRKVERVAEKLWIGGQQGWSDQYTGSMLVLEGAKEKRNTMFTVCVAAPCDDDENEEWAKLLSLWGVQPLGLLSQRKNRNAETGDDDGGDGGSDDDDDDDDAAFNVGFPEPNEGWVRCAFVKRQSDGRYFQFIRPVGLSSSESSSAVGFVNACDALVVINGIDKLSWLTKREPSGRGEGPAINRFIKVPALFVATKTETEEQRKAISEESMAKLHGHDALFTPTKTRGSTFPASAAEADELLNWLVENSQNPRRGVPGAVPAQAFDMPIEDPFMLA